MSSNGKAPAPAAAPPAAPSSTAAAASTSVNANAWAQPLRTKGNVAAPPPGMGKGRGQNSSSNGSASGNSGSNGVQNALRERFIGLSLNMVGQKVVVTQTNGAEFEGIFHTFSPFSNLPAATKNKYVIKACTIIKPPQKTEGSNSDNQPQVVDQSTVIIAADKIATLTAKSMRIDTLSAGNSNGSAQQQGCDAFRTDTEISGPKGGQQQDLVAAGSAWTTGGTAAGKGKAGGAGGGGGNSRAEALMGALGDKDNNKGPRRKPFNYNGNPTAGLRGNIGEWDQFQANQELFNVKASYDENLYTTELDKSQIDNKTIARAERLAREIETTTSTNMHISEERGHKPEGDFDEEDRYSGVIKEGSAKMTVAGSDGKEKPDGQKGTSKGPKKMNYAAAAAKADPKRTSPPGFNPSEATSDTAATKTEKESEQETDVVDEQQAKASSAGTEKSADNPDGKEKKTDAAPVEKPKSTADTTDQSKPAKVLSTGADKNSEAKSSTKLKLNANAKVFSLNATARTFTPGAPSAPAAGAQFVDPNAAMHAGQVAGHIPGPHYMHGGPMGGQQGMMPMMNPQFAGGVRYQQGYGGMDQQHMPQMQPHQAQHVNSSTHGSGAPSPAPGSTEENPALAQQDAEGTISQSSDAQPQQGQAQPPPPQQQVPVPYGVPPPGAYYGGGMGMHPRGPGGPHPGYHPQFVGGPQQIPVGPNGAPYRHMYPMQPGGMPSNPQVRGPGAPYYGGPGTPVPYPPGGYAGHNNMMDDESAFRNGGRGGGTGGRTSRGRGRGRGSSRGGRGRGNYNGYQQQQHGGRGQNQSQGHNGPPENWSSADNGNSPPENSTAGPSHSTPKSEEPAASVQ